MTGMLGEFLFVLSYSRRTQLALWLGLISFTAIMIVGHYMVSGLNFQGVLAPLTEVVREALLNRYEKAAVSVLAGFMLLAVRAYFRDRKRLLSI